MTTSAIANGGAAGTATAARSLVAALRMPTAAAVDAATADAATADAATADAEPVGTGGHSVV